MKRSLLGCLALALFCLACQGEHNDATTDLIGAFQAGCSTDGTFTEIALAQTASLKTTIENLQKQGSCAGLNGALSSIQNLSSTISALNNDPTSIQLKTTQENQQALLLEITTATDPSLKSMLIQAYASNAIEIASLEGEEISYGGRQATPLQQRYTQMSGYLDQLLAGKGDLAACARENPLFGAQLASGLLAVSGSFASPVTGAALSLAGNVLNDLLQFANNKSYSDAINNLNVVGMSDALSCGLESMSNVYCGADDMMELTHLQECSYNPASSSDCPKALLSEPGKDGVSTTDFWKGLDVLSRQLPALQIWIQNVVSGTKATDVYDAHRQNDPSGSSNQMDKIRRLADGWEEQERVLINNLATDVDKHAATVRALSTLVNILACESEASSSSSYFSNCSSTPIFAQYQSTAGILYALVGVPMNGCTGGLGGSCKDANSIDLPGDTDFTSPNGTVTTVKGNGGWEIIVQNERKLFDAVNQQVVEQKREALDTDPGRVLEAAKIPRGVGLPSAFEAMGKIGAFLRASQEHYRHVPAELIDGGEAARSGIISLLDSTASMLDAVVVQVLQISGDPGKDGKTLKSIYDTLNLELDPGFFNQRLVTHIRDDLNLRIKAGEAPSSVDDILRFGAQDAATQLSGVSSSQIDQMYANLGNAKNKSRLNLNVFVNFFSKSLAQSLQTLKEAADKDGEPAGGNPRTAPFRSSQARLCILLASTQDAWPSDVDLSLCSGTFYKSELTGQVLSFDALYAQMGKSGADNAVSKRICTFAEFYNNSAKFTRQKAMGGGK